MFSIKATTTALALSAVTSGKKVQVHISAASSGYNVIDAHYAVK